MAISDTTVVPISSSGGSVGRGELSRRRRAAQALTQVARSVNRSLDPAAVLSAAVDAVGIAVGADGVLIRTLDHETGRLTLAASAGVSPEFQGALRSLGFGEGLAGHVILTHAPIVVEDARQDPRLPWPIVRTERVRSVAVVPIEARTRLLGTLAIFTRHPRRFRAEDLDLLQTIADHVGIALDNARLYDAEVKRVAELRRLSQLQGDFAASVSHELRTPMTVVKTAFDALLREWDGLPEARRLEYLRVGQRGAERLRRLLEDLLLVSRIESCRLDLMLLPIDLSEVVPAAVNDVLDRFARQIVLDLPADLPRVRADRAQLSEILINLIENAARYSEPRTEIGLSATIEDGKVLLDVRDQGVGIAPDDMPRLFQRFERIDRTVSSQAGTGLGLYICKRLIEAMGGTISVVSELGVGSTFRVSLPIAS